MKTIYFNPRAAYESPATRVYEVQLKKSILDGSYGSNIAPLTNQTFSWSDSDWTDAE